MEFKRKRRLPPKISSAAAKDKGRRLQQMVGAEISKLTKFPFGKDKPIESRPMGQSGTDIRLESCVIPFFPFSVECKWQESWSIHDWIKQAKSNVVEGTDWVLFLKKNNQDVVVCLDIEAFFKILTRADFGR